jgi:hypothetical protein
MNIIKLKSNLEKRQIIMSNIKKKRERKKKSQQTYNNSPNIFTLLLQY